MKTMWRKGEGGVARRVLSAVLCLAVLLGFVLAVPRCSSFDTLLRPSEPGRLSMGFAGVEIPLPAEEEGPLYMAGYHQALPVTGVLDLQRANAVWMDAGQGGVLLIGIDCVGLGSDTVADIRQALKGFCRQTGCVAVYVYATHTHAGVDTLGLWGGVAMDGKNEAFMENLIRAAVSAATAAYADRTEGSLWYGCGKTEGLLRDSRAPEVLDETLQQLRFVPADETHNGIRLLSYAAHAEALRGDNTLVSRDYPGAVADLVMAACGDDTLFLPAAVGGLIMTRELVEPFDAVENLRQTAEIIAQAVLSITEETAVTPTLGCASARVSLPLENTVFFYYRFLGILGNRVRKGGGALGYTIETEIAMITLGDVTLALIPGEIFPELVSGEGLSADDPEPLAAIAARYGLTRLIPVGLANDELGYIIPESDFLVDGETPYLTEAVDETGQEHYEETNSVGPETARLLLAAFDTLFAGYTQK